MTSVAQATPRARPNGWWGMLIFVAAEATLFGCLLGSWFYLRLLSVHWPQGGIEPKDPVVPLVLAAVLASTSLLMQAATAGNLLNRGMEQPGDKPLLKALMEVADFPELVFNPAGIDAFFVLLEPGLAEIVFEQRAEGRFRGEHAALDGQVDALEPL